MNQEQETEEAKGKKRRPTSAAHQAIGKIERIVSELDDKDRRKVLRYFAEEAREELGTDG